MRFAVDTGGTFTDLVVEDDSGSLRLFKAPTTPNDPPEGVLDALAIAAEDFGEPLDEFLAKGSLLIHGTTHAINAILTSNTAKTAFLTTAGHEDILFLREGGGARLFDNREYVDPYIPRQDTFGVSERIGSQGEIVHPLDDAEIDRLIDRIEVGGYTAVAVCLLWSIANPVHEARIGERLAVRLPHVQVSLSHLTNPSLREYRRASSTAIDASLKPLMTKYLGSLETRLHDRGFRGRLLVVTSGGGLLTAPDLADRPIHSINSGPALAPVAGKHYAARDLNSDDVIIADAGGTTYDVSLVRRGRIPRTRETWIGEARVGDMTGFPSVDVQSIGAGGGSLAYVDDGGMLHVGPQSAGSQPGPASYGRGGTRPTMTDASLVLGHLDADNFLGGRMRLDLGAARRAIQMHVCEPLGGISVEEGAAAILELATERMVSAIEDTTISQGINPATATIVAGGGAAGLNVVAIARRMGCRDVIIPETVATLSAAGALISDLTGEFSTVWATSSDQFDFEGVGKALDNLREQCEEFIASSGDILESRIEFSVEARYSTQVWELEVPMRSGQIATQDDVTNLMQDFDRLHREVFGVSDDGADITAVHWHARAVCRIGNPDTLRFAASSPAETGTERTVYFPNHGAQTVPVVQIEALAPEARVTGPAILESNFTTVVLDPHTEARATENGSLLVTIEDLAENGR